MQEHLTTQQIQDFAARRLSPDALLTAAQHFGECVACQTRISAASHTHTRTAALRFELTHLSEETLASYLHRSLPTAEQEQANAHLAACEDCATQVWELQTLAPFHLSPIPLESKAHTSLWERVTFSWSQWQTSIHWRPLGWAAGLVAATLLCVTVGWRLWRANDAPRETISRIPTVTAPLATASPALQQPQLLAALQASLLDGTRNITLDEQGHLQGLPALSSADEQLVKTALRDQRLMTPATLKDLRGRASALLGNAQDTVTFALRAPIGVIVRTARPAFRWQPLAGATSYTVAVLDPDFHVIATSPALNATSWTPPQSLPRDRTYLWQVTAQLGVRQITAPAAPAPEARFRILATAQAEALERAERSDSHLLLGLRYAQVGLLAEAERELKGLRADNPQAPLVNKLLLQIQAARR